MIFSYRCLQVWLIAVSIIWALIGDGYFLGVGRNGARNYDLMSLDVLPSECQNLGNWFVASMKLINEPRCMGLASKSIEIELGFLRKAFTVRA